MSAPAAKEAEAQPATPRRARPLQNVTYLTAANFIAKILSFVALLYTTRTLGKGLFGDYTLVLSFVGLFGVFTDCGLNTVAVRDLAQDPRRAVEYTSNILALRTVISIVLVVIISVLARFVESPHIHTAVYVYALALIPISLTITFGIPFQFQERMIYPALISVVSSILTTAAYIFTLWSGHHVLGLVVAFTVVNTVSAAVSAWLAYTRVIPPRLAIDVRSWPGLLRQGAPFFVLTLLLTIYYRADMQILGFLKGCSHTATCDVTGEYGVAYRPLDVLSAIVLGSVSAVVLPLLNRMVAESHAALARVVRMATVLSLTVGVPTALLVTFFAPQAIQVVGGNAYLAAAPALAVLIWTFPCALLESIWFNALYALHRQRVVINAFIVTAIFNIGLNFLLIPHFSYMASAALTVASELLNLAIVFVALRRSLGPLRCATSAAKLTGVVAIASVLLWAVHPLGIIVGLPAGVATIVLAIKLMRLIGPGEREVLASVPLLGRFSALL